MFAFLIPTTTQNLDFTMFYLMIVIALIVIFSILGKAKIRK